MAFLVQSTDEEKIHIVSNPATATGKPAKFDGPLTVVVSSGDGTFSQDPATPNEFFVISGPDAGVTNYLVTGDADLGAGVVPVQDTVTYTVLDAQATSLGLVADAPVTK